MGTADSRKAQRKEKYEQGSNCLFQFDYLNVSAVLGHSLVSVKAVEDVDTAHTKSAKNLHAL